MDRKGNGNGSDWTGPLILFMFMLVMLVATPNNGSVIARLKYGEQETRAAQFYQPPPAHQVQYAPFPNCREFLDEAECTNWDMRKAKWDLEHKK